MGFSQGASMASLLQLLLERPHLSPVMTGLKHDPFKFAIIVSGFEPRDAEKMEWYINKYDVLESKKQNGGSQDGSEDIKENQEPTSLFGVQGASLHVIGRNDVIIEPGTFYSFYPHRLLYASKRWRED
jgi:hypothetical protein